MWKYLDDKENICLPGSLDEKTNLTDFLLFRQQQYFSPSESAHQVFRPFQVGLALCAEVKVGEGRMGDS